MREQYRKICNACFEEKKECFWGFSEFDDDIEMEKNCPNFSEIRNQEEFEDWYNNTSEHAFLEDNGEFIKISEADLCDKIVKASKEAWDFKENIANELIRKDKKND